MPLTIDGRWFRDAHGRAVTLRGVNFGGDCKVPVIPDGHSYRPSHFADHRNVSFVGRPAPLDCIDEHLARIAHWGFNCLRLLTTWEAVEHAGPGEYDETYLDYYAEVCRRAGDHGLYVFVDFHQDVWSRMSGGDGAPGWTFEAAGLDFTKFHAANAAHVMQYNYDHRVGGRQASYPTMSWGGNYRMPANGIMWTLFFAGHDFAPGLKIEGMAASEYLQGHYLGAMSQVAERVANLDNVIGFDSLNEPGSGWIGQGLEERKGLLRGPGWSPLDGLAVAAGLTRELPRLEGGEYVANAGGTSIWLPGHDDPFRAAGAWDIDGDGEARALRPDYFRNVGGRDVSLAPDYMQPFFHRVADTIRRVRDDWLVFAEVDPFEAFVGHGFPDAMPDRTVNASHWYDFSALVTKSFDPQNWVEFPSGTVHSSEQAIEDCYVKGIGALRDIGDRLNGGAPTLIGECGIQYDMNEAGAYVRWAEGDRTPEIWAAQTTALELMYNALDRLQLHSTQWNYTVSNRNDPMIGDGWNQEDLSIWSADQATDPDDPNSGGRAVEGFCRPYAQAVQGTPIRQRFDRHAGIYEFEYDAAEDIAGPTLIYVPEIQFPNGFDLELEGTKREECLQPKFVTLARGKGRVRLTLRARSA